MLCDTEVRLRLDGFAQPQTAKTGTNATAVVIQTQRANFVGGSDRIEVVAPVSRTT
jgi:hypothetical protein